MHSSRTRLGILLALVLALAPAHAAEPPLLVGAVVTESGNLADLAADLRKSLLLWQEQVNGAGGVLGRRVELRLLDDRSEAAAASELYERLIRDERCDLLVGPMGSASTLGAASAAERNRRVLVNATGASHSAQKTTFRYVFQVPAPFASYGAGVLEIARRMGYRRLAIHARNDPGSREMANRLKEEAMAAGLQAAEPEVYGTGTSDFGVQIGKARASHAEAWIAFGLPRDAAEMVKSFRKHGYAPAMFVAQGAADAQFIRLVGQDAEFALGITPWERGFGLRENQRFAEAYTRKWSAEPTHLAAQGYAAAKVLEEAVRRAGSVDQEKVRNELQALELETPLGPYKVDKSGAQLAARPAVVQIQGGRRQVVWPESLATAKWQLPYPRWEERKVLR
ncbi:MAG: amino acid ABC transporter substrate-binding protein [Burkholderiales bacterium]